jgi:hypothetical protein
MNIRASQRIQPDINMGLRNGELLMSRKEAIDNASTMSSTSPRGIGTPVRGLNDNGLPEKLSANMLRKTAKPRTSEGRCSDAIAKVGRAAITIARILNRGS